MDPRHDEWCAGSNMDSQLHMDGASDTPPGNTEKHATTATWFHHFRQWLRRMEDKLKEADDADLDMSLDIGYLEQRLLEQQDFQKEIERDGAVLVASIRKREEEQQVCRTSRNQERQQKRTSTSICSKEDESRCKSWCLERRWHDLWLKSLERQCRLELQLHSIRLGLSNVRIETVDRSEPTAKRRRLDFVDHTSWTTNTRASSVTSDTIPFAEDEYEPIMERILDDNGNVVDEGPRAGSAGDHTVPDIGYSSENSAHLSNNEDDTRPLNKCSSPYRGSITDRPRDMIPKLGFRSRYYKTATWDTDVTTDTDTPRPNVPSPYLQSDAESAHSHSKSPCLLNDSFSTAEPCLDDFLEEAKDFDETFGLRYSMPTAGTVWSPLAPGKHASTPKRQSEPTTDGQCASCDASSELSMDEGRDEHRFSSSKTLLQGSNDLQSMTTPVLGSLKRRRRRNGDRPVSWTRPLPASASETAIMSMSFSSSTTATSPSTKCSMQLGQNDIPWLMTSSMSSSGYGGGGTGSELRTTVWRPRKKLKARRMPRSMSDGEHLSFTNGRYRFPSSGADNVPREDADDDAILGKDESSDPYPRHLDIETPTAPRATPTSDSTEGEDDGGRVFDVDDLLTNVRGGGGEAMAVVDEVGDDGERTAGDGGSTVSGADQSDVYEWDEYKPHHSEHGPPDQPALDDSNLTAFGDDYRAYLGPMSDSCNSAGPSSYREESAALISGARLHPIGRSHDSDSELEETFTKIKESQKQLRLAQNALRHRSPDFASILASCEKNVKDLENILDGYRRAPSSKKPSKDVNDFAPAAALLGDWRHLLQAIKTHIENSMAPAPIAHTGRTRSSEEEERFSRQLQQEMRRLAASLKMTMTQAGSSMTSRPTGTGSYGSMDEIRDDIDFLQTLQRRLMSEQERLDAVVKGYKLFSNRCEAFGHDVQQLSAAFRQARIHFDKQLRELELLYRHWQLWQESEMMCRQLLEDVKSKLGHYEVASPSSRRANHEDVGISHFELLQSQLSKLEERVLRLEAICNTLALRHRLDTPQATTTPSVDESILSSLQDCTASMRRESDALKAKMLELEREVPLIGFELTSLDDEVQKLPLVVNRNGSLKKKSLERQASEKSPKASSDDEIGRLTAARQIFFRYWPIQLCLLILLILDVLFFYPACCEHMNRYWWTFSPKIVYSHGSPPT